MAVLLAVWFAAGLGCGVLWADKLNEYTLPGTTFPLGFWFAQQGSIVIFVLVILVYCILMNRLDRKHHNELVHIRKEEGR
jgi:putative solute:sodium symporter small subunit